MAQRRADERMAGITAAHRFRLGEQRPGWLAKSKAFSSVMRQERNLEIIKKKSLRFILINSLTIYKVCFCLKKIKMPHFFNQITFLSSSQINY